MERTFEKEIEQLKQGQGETFYGEGILAITKALLQSGVSYVGGYQGAPVSHLLDVLVSAKDFMNDLGVHVESCSNEASAAAMLAASISYPVRGAVTWKSIVGTNVASDALSNVASAGVMGGALIVIGEDYGEGASVIQERTLAYALKSTMLMLDPKPNLATMVDMVEHAFRLSEASHMPAMMQLRIRACHVQGEFEAKDNIRPDHGINLPFHDPQSFLYERLSHPPVTFGQEISKYDDRVPAAQRYILENNLNDFVRGQNTRLGIILQGGIYNTVIRQLEEMGLADPYGAPEIDLLVLNVTHPLAPQEITGFCQGKDAVLVMEEGSPEFLEQQILQIVTKAGLATKVRGKDYLPLTGEYMGPVVAEGIATFLDKEGAGTTLDTAFAHVAHMADVQRDGQAVQDQHLPPRPPGFCTGCPERPVFGALKLVEQDIGKVHYAADIGCHSFATFAPFSFGNSLIGYGMSLASNAAVTPMQGRRSIAVMGDGGFWHNGLQTGVVSNLLNKGDGVLMIMQNGYSSATGQQDLPSTFRFQKDATGSDIERTLRTLGVKWLRTVRTYSVSKVVRTLKDALTTTQKGLKVIIADGECMLARQRRERSVKAQRLKQGKRVTQEKFGVDDAICTGDHSCIRMSGCPSLTVKPNPDPLRTEPVAHVNNDCVACGLCGEMAHAAILCPSFYRANRVDNANRWDRTVHRVRQSAIKRLQGASS